MSTTTIAVILLALLVLLLIFWLVRSRGNTIGHIDTSVTAVGAATEAVEDIVESVTHRGEHSFAGEPASAPQSAEPNGREPARAEIPAGGNGADTTPISIAPAQGGPDNLRQMKGVGPKLATRLNELGITRFDQIAAWGPHEIETVDAQLGTFKGRIVRDSWIEQAGYLAKGDVAGFEARFGKLDGNS